MRRNHIIILILFVVCSIFVAGVVTYKDYTGNNKRSLYVEMQSSTTGRVVQVFFDVGHGYDVHDSSINLILHRRLQEYAFSLPSKKTIKSIRFDPIDGPG